MYQFRTYLRFFQYISLVKLEISEYYPFDVCYGENLDELGRRRVEDEKENLYKSTH